MPMTALLQFMLSFKVYQGSEVMKCLNLFFELVKHEAEDKCDPPVLPRNRKLPRSLNNNGDRYSFSSVHELYTKNILSLFTA